MSSSGSRGPPINRYGDRNDYNEYNDYNKSRRKNFYSSASRRDFKSNIPGASAVSYSKVPAKSDNLPPNNESHYSNSSRSRYGGGSLSGSSSLSRSSYGNGPNVRDNRNTYGSYGPSKSTYSSYNPNATPSSYYSSYGNYNSFSASKRDSNDYQAGNTATYYNSRNDSWRSDRVKGGDSRLTSSNKQLPLAASSYSSRISNGTSSLKKSIGSIAASTGEYRKDRYDSYNVSDIPTSGSSNVNVNTNKWKSSYSSNKIPISNNRISLSGSVGKRPFSSKERMKGSPFSGGSSALVNSGKRSDTYYPSRSSYSSNSNQFHKSRVDRYSSKNKYFGSEYPKSRSISGDEDESSISNKKELSDHYSPTNEYDEINSKASDYESSRIEQDETTKESEEEDEGQEEEEEEEEELEEEVEEKYIPDYANEINRESKTLKEENNLVEEEKLGKEDQTQTRISIVTSPQSQPEPRVEPKQETISKEKKPVVKIDVSNEICYPQGCTYPLNHLETEFNALKEEFAKHTKHENENYLKYTLAKPIDDLHDYPSFLNNLKFFAHNKDKITAKLLNKSKNIQMKKLSLWKKYSLGLKLWEVEREKIDQQLKLIHPPDDEMRREIDSSDLRKQNQLLADNTTPNDLVPPPPPSRSRGRRHGDLVTTEAEFQEILQSLGREQDEDPLVRAQRVAAPIPDLILDPIEREYVNFMDSNNIVDDKAKWAQRVKTDFHNNFSAKEHELFCEAFCLYPKRFGAISRHMGGLRTAEDCVVHYYITKKSVNYKQLVAQYKKKGNKKSGRRGKVGRSRNVSQTQTPASTPNNEIAVTAEECAQIQSLAISTVTTDSLGEELFTETGRRKRAAAPVFDGNTKRPDSVAGDEKIDTSLQPTKKKARKKKEEVTDSVSISARIESNEISTTVQGATVSEVDSEVSAVDNNEDSKERRRTISSYWSITEANLFPSLLMEHGTKWTTIADKLATKTATMVRNYFQRNADKNGWNQIAEEADARLKAKFDAVLGAQPEAQIETNEEPEKYTVSYPAAPSFNTMTTPIVSQYVPIGTFQHTTSAISKQELSSLSSVTVIPQPTNVGPSISSLLTDIKTNSADKESTSKVKFEPEVSHTMAKKIASAPVVSVTHPQYPPQKASIMSLLNSDSSPTKPAPTSNPPPKSSTLTGKNNLHDLLNSPSSPKGAAFTSPEHGKLNGINALLSATNSSYTNGNHDRSNE